MSEDCVETQKGAIEQAHSHLTEVYNSTMELQTIIEKKLDVLYGLHASSPEKEIEKDKGLFSLMRDMMESIDKCISTATNMINGL